MTWNLKYSLRSFDPILHRRRPPPPGTKQDRSPSSPQNGVKNISGRVMGKARTKKEAAHGLLFFIWSWSCDTTRIKSRHVAASQRFYTPLINDDPSQEATEMCHFVKATFFCLNPDRARGAHISTLAPVITVLLQSHVFLFVCFSW